MFAIKIVAPRAYCGGFSRDSRRVGIGGGGGMTSDGISSDIVFNGDGCEQLKGGVVTYGGGLCRCFRTFFFAIYTNYLRAAR